MSNEVKRVMKKVEVEVVELKIQLSSEFFNNMDEAKKQVAEQRGYDVTYGEYMEEALDDLVKMVEEYSAKLIQASDIIKEQDNALGNPTPEEYKKIKDGEKPVDPESGEVEEDVPESMYAHIVEDSAKEIMYV